MHVIKEARGIKTSNLRELFIIQSLIMVNISERGNNHKPIHIYRTVSICIETCVVAKKQKPPTQRTKGGPPCASISQLA